MEILRRFTEKSVKPRIYTVKAAERNVRKGLKEALALQNSTIVVDFSEVLSYTDPNTSDACVSVLSSDGRVGTLSHLQTNANVTAIADNLLSIHKGPTPICLAGGSDSISRSLIAKIVETFRMRGFTLSNLPASNSLGGSLVYRRATIFPDRVVVNCEPYSGKPEVVNLVFPSE